MTTLEIVLALVTALQTLTLIGAWAWLERRIPTLVWRLNALESKLAQFQVWRAAAMVDIVRTTERVQLLEAHSDAFEEDTL